MNNPIHLEDDGMCYACGKRNEKGLHLEFTFSEQGKTVETTFVPTEVHQGWQRIVHGGIIVTLMDEAMAKLVNLLGYHALTASIEVRFKNVARVMEPLSVKAEVGKITKRIIFTRAFVSSGDGRVVAEGRAKLMIY